jgi:hypothetical protein
MTCVSAAVVLACNKFTTNWVVQYSAWLDTSCQFDSKQTAGTIHSSISAASHTVAGFDASAFATELVIDYGG